MGWRTLPKVWDGLGNSRGGPGWVGGHFRRFGTGQRTLPEVRDWSGTLPEVRDRSGTLGEVRYWSGDPQGGSRRVGGPTRRSGMHWWTLMEVLVGSVDPRGGPGRGGRPSRGSVTGSSTLP